MADKKELGMNELGNVNGGCYVNVTMSIDQIISTDRNLASILNQAGITVTGNKAMRGQSLYEVAQTKGIDPYMLEDVMNEYLGAK